MDYLVKIYSPLFHLYTQGIINFLVSYFQHNEFNEFIVDF